MGHLRRPGVQEDGSTENVGVFSLSRQACKSLIGVNHFQVFAATALMLCIRDIISDVERSFSWKLHLQGAFTVLNQNGSHLSHAVQNVRRILSKVASSLHLRSLLPAPHSTQAGPSLNRDLDGLDGMNSLPERMMVVLRDIRTLRQERSALRNIELH